jgi:hypothetical protein
MITRTDYPASAGVCRRTAMAVVLLAALSTAVAAGQDATEVARDVANVQPFLLETTVLVVKFDTTRIELPEVGTVVESLTPAARPVVEKSLRQASESLTTFRGLVENQPCYATIGVPISGDRVPVFVFTRLEQPAEAAGLLEFLQQERRSEAWTYRDYVVAVPNRAAFDDKMLSQATPSQRPDLIPAWQSVQQYPIQVLLLPPEYWRRTLRELPFQLPEQLGGGSSSLISEGVQWAALGISLGELRAELIVQSFGDEAARQLAAHLPKMLRAAGQAIVKESNNQIPAELASALVDVLPTQVDGDRITVRFDGRASNQGAVKLLTVVSQMFRTEAERHRNSYRFKQIMLGMHNYHEVFKSFPPADKYRDENGRQLLSWRVHILPYVEQAELYQQFKLDEPWDSPHNKPLLEKMPDIYASAELGGLRDQRTRPGYTTFQTPVGEGTAFGQEKSSRFGNFLDGTSNTVVLVEVKPEKAVPWTAPDDYRFDPKDPGAGLLIGPDGRWLATLADGSVHEFRSDVSAETLLRLFQVSDGNMIEFNQLR